VAKVTKKSGTTSSTSAYKSKSKKTGKAKKQYGPKEQRPKAYRGQGR
jgi:hypothetical protein